MEVLAYGDLATCLVFNKYLATEPTPGPKYGDGFWITIIPVVQKQATGKVKPSDFCDCGAERRKNH